MLETSDGTQIPHAAFVCFGPKRRFTDAFPCETNEACFPNDLMPNPPPSWKQARPAPSSAPMRSRARVLVCALNLRGVHDDSNVAVADDVAHVADGARWRTPLFDVSASSVSVRCDDDRTFNIAGVSGYPAVPDSEKLAGKNQAFFTAHTSALLPSLEPADAIPFWELDAKDDLFVVSSLAPVTTVGVMRGYFNWDGWKAGVDGTEGIRQFPPTLHVEYTSLVSDDLMHNTSRPHDDANNIDLGEHDPGIVPRLSTTAGPLIRLPRGLCGKSMPQGCLLGLGHRHYDMDDEELLPERLRGKDTNEERQGASSAGLFGTYYTHFFYALSIEPPFRLSAASTEFCFPAGKVGGSGLLFGKSSPIYRRGLGAGVDDCEGIQFADAPKLVKNDGDATMVDLLIVYGALDCVSKAIRVPLRVAVGELRLLS